MGKVGVISGNMQRIQACKAVNGILPNLMEHPKLITIKAGIYGGLGGGNSPVYDVELPRDHRLLLLTTDLLIPFRKNRDLIGIARDAGLRIEDLTAGDVHKKRGAIVGDIMSMSNVLGLLEIIDPQLRPQNLRLRLPAEPLVEALLRAREYESIRNRVEFGSVVTASRYDAKGPDVEGLDIELKREEVKDEDKFVLLSSIYPGRYDIKAGERVQINCILYEVVGLK
ncbi:MAG: hypothetical protein NT030_07650 [Candidatus Saganbacteria bacterium]|nr:hypothetical protein [Candidatus Saganbacteria bacterium]